MNENETENFQSIIIHFYERSVPTPLPLHNQRLKISHLLHVYADVALSLPTRNVARLEAEYILNQY